jgi:hypothetical protein
MKNGFRQGNLIVEPSHRFIVFRVTGTMIPAAKKRIGPEAAKNDGTFFDSQEIMKGLFMTKGLLPSTSTFSTQPRQR